MAREVTLNSLVCHEVLLDGLPLHCAAAIAASALPLPHGGGGFCDAVRAALQPYLARREGGHGGVSQALPDLLTGMLAHVLLYHPTVAPGCLGNGGKDSGGGGALPGDSGVYQAFEGPAGRRCLHALDMEEAMAPGWALRVSGRVWSLEYHSPRGEGRSSGIGDDDRGCVGRLEFTLPADAYALSGRGAVLFYLLFGATGWSTNLPLESSEVPLDWMRAESARILRAARGNLLGACGQGFRRLFVCLSQATAGCQAEVDPFKECSSHACILLLRIVYIALAECCGLLPSYPPGGADPQAGAAVSLSAIVDALCEEEEVHAAEKGSAGMGSDKGEGSSNSSSSSSSSSSSGGGGGSSSSSSNTWQLLCDLFEGIRNGNSATGSPAHTGVLFSSLKYEHRSEIPYQRLCSPDLGQRLAEAICSFTTHTNYTRRRRICCGHVLPRDLGSLYEMLMGFRNPCDADLSGNDTRQRLRQGAYYTPEIAVDITVSSTLTRACQDAIAGALRRCQSPVQALLNLRIIDPSVGSGCFAAAAVLHVSQAISTCVEEAAVVSPGFRIASPLPHHCEDGPTQAGNVGCTWPHVPHFHSHRMQKDDDAPLATDEEMLRCPEWVRWQVAARCMHGVDLDPLAISLTRCIVALSCRRAAGATGPCAGDCGAVPLWLRACRQTAFARLLGQYCHGDAIMGCVHRTDVVPDEFAAWFTASIDGKASDKPALHWHQAFPQVCDADGHVFFDVVVANPPWDVLQPQKRTWYKDDRVYESDKRYYARLKRFLAASGQYTSVTGGSKINAFMPFLERCVLLLRPGGHMAFLVQNSILSSTSSSTLRRFAAQQLHIRVMLEFGKKVLFPEVNKGCIILSATKKMIASPAAMAAHSWTGGGAAMEEERDSSQCFQYGFVGTSTLLDGILSPDNEGWVDRPGSSAVFLGSDAHFTLRLPVGMERLQSLLTSAYDLGPPTYSEVGMSAGDRAPLYPYGAFANVCTGVYLYKISGHIAAEGTTTHWCRVIRGPSVMPFRMMPSEPWVWVHAKALRGNWLAAGSRIVMRAVMDFMSCRRFCACVVDGAGLAGDHSTTVHEFGLHLPCLPTERQRCDFFAALLNSRLLEWVFRMADRNDNVNTSKLLLLPVPDMANIIPATALSVEGVALALCKLIDNLAQPLCLWTGVPAACGSTCLDAVPQGLLCGVIATLSRYAAAQPTAEGSIGRGADLTLERTVVVLDVLVCGLYGLGEQETRFILDKYDCGFARGPVCGKWTSCLGAAPGLASGGRKPTSPTGEGGLAPPFVNGSAAISGQTRQASPPIAVPVVNTMMVGVPMSRVPMVTIPSAEPLPALLYWPHPLPPSRPLGNMFDAAKRTPGLATLTVPTELPAKRSAVAPGFGNDNV